MKVGDYEIHHGDCLEVLKRFNDSSVDSIVTDPPYGLSFMGKKWDYDVPGVDIWSECLRVLKPGGHLLSFGGSRTYHRMAVNIEDAGFEIRDQIMWVYGSGFPKSHDVSKAIDKAAGAEREVVGVGVTGVSFADPGKRGFGSGTMQTNITAPATEAAKQWQGWGTALKPAHEPICMARKPFKGTVAQNVLEHGTGAINVDGGRVPLEENCRLLKGGTYGQDRGSDKGSSIFGTNNSGFDYEVPKGRWPANLIHDGSEESTGGMGDCQRYFYAAKASKRDRDEGLDRMTLVVLYLEPCEKNTTNREKLATLLVDTETLRLKATGEFGTSLAAGKEWSMFLFGNRFTEAYKTECKSTTSTGTNSTTESRILSALARSITSDCIQDANSEMVSGGNRVANAAPCNILTFTTSEKTALALGAKPAARKMRLSISVEGGRNVHSTVKPTDLMRYLCRLVTPPGGTVLDPFCGSGSTGKAAVREGFDFVGVEREAEYVEIAQKRISHEN